MSDKNIEKSFLYLILLSILFHVAAYSLLSLIPPDPQRLPKETTMVELKDLPDPPPAVRPKPKSTPVPMVRTPMLPPEKALPQARKEAAPKAEDKIDRISHGKKNLDLPRKADPIPPVAKSPGKTEAISRASENERTEIRRGEGLLKPRTGEKIELSRLFPSARNMESSEENYRKKYRDAEQGDTRMIDTDDPLIGVFSHRLLVAAQNSVDLEASKRDVIGAGVGVMMVTVNRDGTIEDIKILESSRNRTIDEFFVTAVKKAGYVGPLPKKWPHEKFRVIWVFRSQNDFRVSR